MAASVNFGLTKSIIPYPFYMYIGKLSLYCAAGGIAPHRVMPVVIDVGTDNEELLNDKFYLGVQKRRLQGRAYYEVIDEFMQAVRYRWPNVLVQFEDFSSDKAQVCTFISKKHCWLVGCRFGCFLFFSFRSLGYPISSLE